MCRVYRNPLLPSRSYVRICYRFGSLRGQHVEIPQAMAKTPLTAAGHISFIREPQVNTYRTPHARSAHGRLKCDDQPAHGHARMPHIADQHFSRNPEREAY